MRMQSFHKGTKSLQGSADAQSIYGRHESCSLRAAVTLSLITETPVYFILLTDEPDNTELCQQASCLKDQLLFFSSQV